MSAGEAGGFPVDKSGADRDQRLIQISSTACPAGTAPLEVAQGSEIEGFSGLLRKSTGPITTGLKEVFNFIKHHRFDEFDPTGATGERHPPRSRDEVFHSA
jgi:hypothetical protein